MNNELIYNAVLAGISGSTQNLRQGVSRAADYTSYADRAAVLALAVDALIAPAAITEAEAQMMGQIVAGIDLQRCFVGKTPAYATIATDILAMWNEFKGRISPTFGSLSLYAADFVAARTLGPILAHANEVNIACHTTVAGGGGGSFDVYPKGAYVDDNGWYLVIGNYALVRRERNNGLFVRDFGALGNGVADDQPKFVAALAKIPNGGTLLTGDGVFSLATPIPLISGQTIQGTGGVYHGACRLHVATKGSSAITIGQRVIRAGVRDIAIEGNGTLTINADPLLSIEYNDSYGIKMEGNFPESSYQHVFSGITFYQLGTCIYANSLTVPQWQIDDILVSHCVFVECGHSLHLNSQNVTYWHCDNCGFSTAKTNGVAVRIERCGSIEFSACAGGGFNNTGTYMRVEMSAATLLNLCQSENCEYSLVSTGGSSITHIETACDGKVLLEQSGKLNLIGGWVTSQLIAHNSSTITNTGCAVNSYVLDTFASVTSEVRNGITKRFISEHNPTGLPVETAEGGYDVTSVLTDALTAYALPNGNFRIDCCLYAAVGGGTVNIYAYHDSITGGSQDLLFSGVLLAGFTLIPSYIVPAQRGSGTGGYIVIKVTSNQNNNHRLFASIDNVSGLFR